MYTKCSTSTTLTSNTSLALDSSPIGSSSGLDNPYPAGHFVIERPHATFYSPPWFNVDTEDPFPRWEEVTMDEGDILLVTAVKAGE